MKFYTLFACALLLNAQVVITHVTVVDTAAGQLRADMTVIVNGDHISDVTVANMAKIPPRAHVVDGRGKFLIPGLWDMHVHMNAGPGSPRADAGRTFFAPVLVANGITGVRSMADSLAMIQDLRDAIRGGAPGPRIVTAGPILDGPKPMWPEQSIACSDAEQARKAIRRLKGDGVDFIKVYERLDFETYSAIAAEAKAIGLPFAGHVPRTITAGQASDAGQKSIEHLSGIFLSCSSQEDELRGELAKSGSSRSLIDGTASQSYDAEKAAALFAKFRTNDTWQTPTLALHRALALTGDPDFMKDPRWRIFKENPVWASAQPIPRGWSPSERRKYFDREIALVGAMHRVGIKILAGTDTANPYVYPGDSLHEELQLLVKAGFTPMEALQAATIRPAEYLKMSHRLGSIAPGKTADLVLLDRNPLANIQNTRRIAAVVLNGTYYERE